jgi:hypothetical protein
VSRELHPPVYLIPLSLNQTKPSTVFLSRVKVFAFGLGAVTARADMHNHPSLLFSSRVLFALGPVGES